MLDQPIVSVSGLRGIVGESFTAEIIVPYVAAFADWVGRKRVIIGGDSRPSREWAEPVVEAVLRARGVEVISIGLAPTPTIGMMVRDLKAGGGIAITASHNPIEWNGLKFFSDKGEFLGEKDYARLSGLMKSPPRVSRAVPVGASIRDDQSITRHLNRVVKVLKPLVPAKKRRLRVVLDCCNGAGSILVPLVATAFGATTEVINMNPGRPFPRGAEPLPENIGMLGREVRRVGADFGAALDPDADRLALVDENGRPLGEERTFILAADAWLSRSKSKTALGVNLSTTQAVEYLAEAYGSKVVRSKIGEAHVLAAMRKAKAALGGEGNGGVILPAIHPGRDAATALALVLIGMHARRGTLSQWNHAYPDFVMIKTKIERGRVPLKQTFTRARKHFKDAVAIDTTDGMKLIFDDSFIHLRPSNTEPILRVFIESPDKGTAKHFLARVQAILA